MSRYTCNPVICTQFVVVEAIAGTPQCFVRLEYPSELHGVGRGSREYWASLSVSRDYKVSVANTMSSDHSPATALLHRHGPVHCLHQWQDRRALRTRSDGLRA